MNNIRKIGELCWLDIKTSDMTTSKLFYKKLFGWEYHDENWPHKIYTIIRKDGDRLGGLTDLNLAPLPLGTAPHISVYIAAHSVDDMTENCEKFNGQVLVEPFDLEDLMRMSVIQEPEGAVFSLLEKGTFQAMNAEPRKEGVPCWFELITPDLSKSAACYTQSLGWTLSASEKASDQSLYIQCGEQVIGKMTASSRERPPEWVVYYNVNSIEHEAERTPALGAQRLADIREICAYRQGSDIRRFSRNDIRSFGICELIDLLPGSP
ncbi:VOC family protein [Paenibacillus ginsengihumi]|uniref:VOC family protein n=1 Tax=Paenibacillus ginsengihumi TaxID=431596 RepID=UPI000381FB7F|nr:VOC family protein [Paenibacillus ginsengihumi]